MSPLKLYNNNTDLFLTVSVLLFSVETETHFLGQVFSTEKHKNLLDAKQNHLLHKRNISTLNDRISLSKLQSMM